MTAERNEGIVNRGTISGHSIAVGRGARAITTIESSAAALEDAGHEDLAARLDELKAQMVAHSAAIDGFEDAMEALEVVAAELASQKPNRVTVRGVLEGLMSTLRSIGGVAEAAAALKVAAEALL